MIQHFATLQAVLGAPCFFQPVHALQPTVLKEETVPTPTLSFVT
jgi:hypothetical protein